MVDGRFEYPLPVLYLDKDELFIESSERSHGYLKIKNTGGATLSGNILSRSRCVVFEPEQWEGNETTISYRFIPEEAEAVKPGENLETCAYICSNGGEKRISITVRFIKMAIEVNEGRIIANIRDFYEYARDYPTQARRLFTDSEFYMLLLATGYKYMEAYEMLHKDANRERAMDNFFIMSGLKKKTTLSLQKNYMEFIKTPHDTSMIHGNFLVQKSDDGFYETTVYTENNAAWLALSGNRLITADFNEANTAMIKFNINPLLIKERYAREKIVFGPASPRDGSSEMEIVFKKSPELIIKLNKESYKFDDRGFIQIMNNTGSDLKMDLFCKESYIRFAARAYMVGPYYEIPFEIKLSAFISAQLLFRKTPYLRAGIEIKTIVRDFLVKRLLPLTIGEW